MDPIPNEQTAWVVTRRALPSRALVLKTDWPVPKRLEAGEVLVRVEAAALNPAGWKLMALLPHFILKRPYVPEFDFSGVVADSNGTEFVNGDVIFGWVPGDFQRKSGQGALAQYLRVPSHAIVKRPSNISPVEASGITLTALTSYQAIIRLGQVEAGQTVFINGGSSALGAFAIQFAKAKGATVVATASGKNEDFVRRMGTDEFIDYTIKPLHDHLSQKPPNTKYHLIYDAIGLIDPSLFTHSEKYLAPDGIFISAGPFPKDTSFPELWKLVRTLGAMITPAWLGGVNRRYILIRTKHDPEDLEEIRKLIENGTVKPIVDSTHKMEDAPKAYERIMSSRATGKVVVIIDTTQ